MRWFFGVIFFVSGAVFAAPSMYDMLSEDQYQSPLTMLHLVEQDHDGVISEFEIDVDNGQLNYRINLIDTVESTITEFHYRARDGALLRQRVDKLEADDADELEAANLLQKKKLTFSHLVELATAKSTAYLVEAQLDHDLGISYLELKLADESGKHKLAFDIENLRPLPLLKWD